MHDKGGGEVWQRAVCMVKGGHAWYSHPPALLQGTAGQCAGSTHPTAMHSCFVVELNLKRNP